MQGKEETLASEQRSQSCESCLEEPTFAGPNWRIGIFAGIAPFKVKDIETIRNPVFTADDVSDIDAAFVADPFMIRSGHHWHMFFEAMNKQREMGEIGYASSPNGLQWTYQQIVLREPYHLSYPYVFRWHEDYFMIPETLEPEAIRLYRAHRFPGDWQYEATLIEDVFVDSSIVRFAEKWWIFTCAAPFESDSLRLFFADSLDGKWTEHPKSPLVDGDKTRARPAGRLTPWRNGLLRFAQDCGNGYGKRVRAFEITCLTPTDYSEHELEESPILEPGRDAWNNSKMHHIDPHRMSDGSWLACVDGESGQNRARELLVNFG